MRQLNPRGAMKNKWYLDMYHSLFAAKQDDPIELLELGVLSGDSLAMWADYFPKARVSGLDFENTVTSNLKAYAGRLLIFKGDQADTDVLRQIVGYHENQFDIIIDDAAHQGAKARASYNYLFPFLKPGGFYIIEDWGTGYWPEWPDGREPTNMVALVKELVDEAGYPDTRREPRRESLFEWMLVSYGMCVIKKK